MNKIINTDALEFLSNLEMESVDLIYVDPPYMTNRDFFMKEKLAFTDKYELNEYIDLAKEISEASRLKLKKTGLIAVHVDWHVSHHWRTILENTFGSDNFVNKVIWAYKTGGSSKKCLSKKYDEIIIYSKTKKFKYNQIKEKSYNRGFKPYKFKGIKEYKDDVGWYTMVNMKDVWTDIPALGRTSGERTGYPTQKPVELGKRLIELFTDKNDLVVDPMCGSGFIGEACVLSGRKFMLNDISELSYQITEKRISNLRIKGC